MRGMTSASRLMVLVAALGIGAMACNEKTGADKFVGTWTYAGLVNANCLDIAPIDLTGATATITATDKSHIVVDLEGFCRINLEVDGFSASAGAGQTCTLEIPGLGPVAIAITSWTLSMAGGDVIDSAFTGSALGCFPSGTGTLTRQGDAGAVD
jgi:hypothetical protein